MMTTPPLPPDPQQIRDEEHLKLLSIFHYVVGGIHCAFAALFTLHLLFMLAMLFIPIFAVRPGEVMPPVFVGFFMFGFFGLFVLCGLALGISTIFSGRFIKQRKHRLFSLIVAGINCMMFPFGTALGVFAFIVLVRDSVRRVYETKPI